MNILISGISCSGKTTFADEINGLHFEQDWYFKDKKEIPICKKGYLFDSPNAFHQGEFRRDVMTLLSQGEVFVPNYDIKINRRISKDRLIVSRKINVFEGLHTINELKDLSDALKIFMDIPLDEILERRIKRDLRYGIKESEIIRYFKEVMIPMYRMYIEPQKQYTDIVIESEGDKLCLLKKLQTLS